MKVENKPHINRQKDYYVKRICYIFQSFEYAGLQRILKDKNCIYLQTFFKTNNIQLYFIPNLL
jgi:hypothetical protein